MYSIIEQLYFVPSFRKDVISIEDEVFKGKKLEDSVLYQLRESFKAKDSIYKPLGLESFAKACRDIEGKPMKPTDQIDAVEFMNILFESLENEVKATKYEGLVKNSFKGLFSHEILNKCAHNHNFSRDEEFLNINLSVKNLKNIKESLVQFIEEETIEGYSCKTCEKKDDALKRISIKNSPNHLILSLKRFEFDYNIFTNVMILDYFELPSTLNIKPFTQHELSKKDGEVNEESKNSDSELSPSHFEYKLAGIIIYSGPMGSGLYYSIVQNREDESWYKYYQDKVSKFDPKDLPEEAFGISKDSKSLPFKNNCAYVAFYDRIKPEKVKEEKED